MRKRRIDWDEEERRSNRSRALGLKYTFISLLATFGVTLGLKYRYPEIDFSQVLTVMGALLGGVALLVLLARRK